MLFDYSKSGKISARDIGPVIRSVGLKPSQAEIRSIVTDVQSSGKPAVCFFSCPCDSNGVLQFACQGFTLLM